MGQGRSLTEPVRHLWPRDLPGRQRLRPGDGDLERRKLSATGWQQHIHRDRRWRLHQPELPVVAPPAERLLADAPAVWRRDMESDLFRRLLRARHLLCRRLGQTTRLDRLLRHIRTELLHADDVHLGHAGRGALLAAAGRHGDHPHGRFVRLRRRVPVLGPPPGGSWTSLGPFTSTNTATWSTAQAGNYALVVWVRPQGSSTQYATYGMTNFTLQ